VGFKAALNKWADPEENFGERVEGIPFRVFNEREIRAAAGLLFALGFSGWMIALTTGNYMPLRAFGVAFMFDMALRLFVSPRAVPSLIIARLIVRKQAPEWVDAVPKKLAWTIGLVMVITSCFSMGWLGLTGPIVLALCGVCILFLYLETAFGICIGCHLQVRFSSRKPRLCPGGICEADFTAKPTKQNPRN
jgi:hypothetical protein